MLVREPIDDVLSVADVDTRICRVAARQMHGPCLLDRIFIRAQISAGGILRKSFFTRKRRPVETICPQRLVLEINLRDLRALCTLRRCLGSLGGLRPPMSVVVPCDNSSQQETHDAQHGRLRKSHQQCLLFPQNGSMPNHSRFTKQLKCMIDGRSHPALTKAGNGKIVDKR